MKKIITCVASVALACTCVPAAGIIAPQIVMAETVEDTNVAKIGNNTYETLAEAFAAAKAGDTIELLVDEIDNLHGIPEGVTIQGKEDKTTLTGKYEGDDGQVTGSLNNVTFKNIKFAGEGNAMRYCYGSGEKIVLDNCDFDCDQQYGIHFDELNADLIVKNSTIRGTVAISATENDITFDNCNFAGRTKVAQKCNINCYSDFTFNNCQFSDDYTNGKSRGILMTDGSTHAEDVLVTLNNCSLSNSESEYSLNDIFRRDCLCVGVINGCFDKEGGAYAGYVIKRNSLVTSPLKIAQGCKLAQIGTETPDQDADFYVIGYGEDVESVNNKLTGGLYTYIPDGFLAEGYKVVASGNTVFPFKVTEGTVTPGEPEKIVTEDNEKQVDYETIDPEDVETVEEAVKESYSEGVTNAMTSTAKDELIQDAIARGGDITQESIDDSSVVTVDIVVEITATGSDQPSLDLGSVKYDVTPKATVTTRKDGVETGSETGLIVPNDYLSGETFNVVLGCAGIQPIQVVHTCSDGTVEVFLLGASASYKDHTFSYNSTDKTITVEIAKFSDIEILGTSQYVNVTFDPNGGEGEMYPQGVRINEDTELYDCEYTRKDYSFSGWSLEKTGAIITSVNIDEDTTVYAQWKKTDPTASKKPSGVNTTYSGNSQCLIATQGELSDGGTMYYSLDKKSWVTYDKLEAVDAKVYDVWYGYKKGDEYKELDKITATIGKADISTSKLTIDCPKDPITFDEKAHPATATLNSPYKLGGGAALQIEYVDEAEKKSTEAPVNVGKYKVYAVVPETATNFNKGSVQIGTIEIKNIEDGWRTIEGKTYYYKDGKPLKGWNTVEGKRYWFDKEDGVMHVSEWYTTEYGNKYYVGKDGVMVTGWQTIDGKRYWFDKEVGRMQKNAWYTTEYGNKYYVGADGVMVTGWQTIDGKRYWFDKEVGRMQKSRWYTTEYGNKYYVGEDGVMVTGWQTIDGKRYWFDKEVGRMQKNAWYTTEYGNKYYVGEDGVMYTGWHTIDNERYWFDKEVGRMQKSKWYTTEYGNKYYVLEDGKAARNGWWILTMEDGTIKKCTFNADGRMTSAV